MPNDRDDWADVGTNESRGAERRNGGDRRGSGYRQPPSKIARPYGFRSFDERRSNRDFAQANSGLGAGGSPAWETPFERISFAAAATVVLTPEEIRILLSDPAAE